MIEQHTLGDRIFNAFLYVFLGGIALLSLLPFWIMVMAAFTDDLTLRAQGYLPWIPKFSLEAFKWVLAGTQVQTGYLVTIFVTVVGTLASLFVMSMLAYVMSLKRLKGRSALAFLCATAVTSVARCSTLGSSSTYGASGTFIPEQ